MTARDLHRWLRSLHPIAEPSVDQIIVGEPDKVVGRIAVAWMPTWDTLRAAHEHGCNLVVAHEPTFFAHHESRGFDEEFPDLPPLARKSVVETREAKRRWIEENGMVVIRCHDVLDAMPGGVVDAFGAALGFTDADCVSSVHHHRLIRVDPPVRAEVLAQRIANVLAQVGQPGVAFHGDPARLIRRLGLGTGYSCQPWTFLEMGADMAVTIDDRIKTWTECEWADDSGFPMIVIHHGASEEWGVRRLCDLMANQFPHHRVQLLPQGFRCRWIAPHSS
ncbi:MAG: Nif3-like dinuclear metal center hexameric protein [Opitutus sp.]